MGNEELIVGPRGLGYGRRWERRRRRRRVNRMIVCYSKIDVEVVDHGLVVGSWSWSCCYYSKKDGLSRMSKYGGSVIINMS